MSGRRGFDPIRLELIKNGLDAIVEEMAMALMRSAYSPNLKMSMDMSCALCDAEGRLIAQGLTIPMHLGSIPHAMTALLAKFEGRIEPGDVFLLNDPYQGGTHLPDFYVFRPIFAAGRLAGWSIAIGHMSDVGGKTPGGNGADATEIVQEGLRIPPLKLYEHGEPVEPLFTLIERNVRVPRLVLGDVRALVAACLTGERGYLGLADRYGLDSLAESTDALLDQAERLARTAIAAMPDGTYTFLDHIDDDGMDPDPIPIRVTITVEGDRLTCDFEGSAPQVRGAINSAWPYTKSAVYACVRHLIGGDPPNNEGYFRPIEIRAPIGTVVNPAPPAPVAARGLTGYRITNAIFGALAGIAPDRIPACEAGGDTGLAFGGYLAGGNPFVFVEFVFGGWGGRPRLDGVDVCASMTVNFSNNPVEVVEAEYPIRIERYDYAADTGGAGLHRGSLSVARSYRFLAEGTLALRSDRRRFLPYGLAGGGDGTPSASFLDGAEGTTTLPAKLTTRVRPGERFRHTVAGAGGWGDPLERDSELVLRDVREEKLTAAYAEREYGVVLTPAGDAVDEAATAALRTRQRGDR